MPSKISYLDELVHPVTGCSPIGPACQKCWARGYLNRFGKNMGRSSDIGFSVMHHFGYREKIYKLKKPTVIGVAFMGDLFHDDAKPSAARDVIDCARQIKQHKYILPTKRYKNMRTMANSSADYYGEWFPNIWWGMSVWDQESFDRAMDEMNQMPREINKWLSIEPLLGPIDIKPDQLGVCKGCDSPYHKPEYRRHCCCPECSHSVPPPAQIIVGGESGSGARPMNPDWVRSIRDACAEAGIPFYFKQWSGNNRGLILRGLPVLDGKVYDDLAWRK